jgi:two-component system, OmpR family, response regulator
MSADRMSADRVLLVDDEEDFLATLAERLAMRGTEVVTARTGEEGIEVIRERDFDAAVLDLAMPGIDGIETFRRMRRIRPEMQVVLLTGHATVAQGVEAMKLGAVDLLEKPMDIRDLQSRIEECSENRAVLLERHLAEYAADILKRKGW